MDLGIAGRKAIVCASSRGLGRACANALAEAGCEVVINGRNKEQLAATAAELRKATGAKIIAGRRRRRLAGRPEGAVRRLPRAGHPGQQQCRPAVSRFPRARPAEDDRRRHRQHDRRRGTDSEGDRSDGRQKIRPHRQHHLRLGEDAAVRPRSVVRRARRPDRLPRRRGALGRRLERHHQFHAAGHFRHRPLPLQRGVDREEDAASVTTKRSRRTHRLGSGKAPRHSRTNSAPPAPSCARRRPATSPDRTFSSTAECSPARFESLSKHRFKETNS